MAETDGKHFCKWNKKLLILVYFTYFIFLGIAAFFVYRTFCPQKIRFPKSIEISFVDAKGKAKDLSAEGKAHVKEQLHMALMEVSGKAEAAYNEKFATLLTILSVFGVAWPLILGLLQFRFNERELKKIRKTKGKIKEIEQTAKKAEEQADLASKIASDSQASMIDNQILVKELESIKNNIYNDYPFIYQTLASYFSNLRVSLVTEENQTKYLMYFVFELEMGLKGLYCACLLNNTVAIDDLQKKVLKFLQKYDDFKNNNNISEKQEMSHLNSFSWDLIQSKVEPKVFSEIKDLYDKHFYKEGEK